MTLSTMPLRVICWRLGFLAACLRTGFCAGPLFEVGDEVDCWHSGNWYPGKLKAKTEEGLWKVDFTHCEYMDPPHWFGNKPEICLEKVENYKSTIASLSKLEDGGERFWKAEDMRHGVKVWTFKDIKEADEGFHNLFKAWLETQQKPIPFENCMKPPNSPFYAGTAFYYLNQEIQEAIKANKDTMNKCFQDGLFRFVQEHMVMCGSRPSTGTKKLSVQTPATFAHKKGNYTFIHNDDTSETHKYTLVLPIKRATEGGKFVVSRKPVELYPWYSNTAEPTIQLAGTDEKRYIRNIIGKTEEGEHVRPVEILKHVDMGPLIADRRYDLEGKLLEDDDENQVAFMVFRVPHYHARFKVEEGENLSYSMFLRVDE